MQFPSARCTCPDHPLLLSGQFNGVVQVKCRKCKRRAWVVSDGAELQVLLTDQPRRRFDDGDTST